MCNAIRTAVMAIFLYGLVGNSAVAQLQGPLPTPPQELGEDVSLLTPQPEPYCPAFEHRPLSELTVDVRPVDSEGVLVAESQLPANCMPASATGPRPLVLNQAPGTFECSCRDLLQLARFCHPKLLFEDPLLERYGANYVCPSCHAVREFTCDLVLLPARLLVYHRQPCVRTPTPHCFSACGVCGY